MEIAAGEPIKKQASVEQCCNLCEQKNMVCKKLGKYWCSCHYRKT
ncbi:hypothetical protein MAR_032847 [Mya arenaria]|uniref:Uncharacterized protein n=1 Tax=Mya arenaria TaxID=6604 RepID=A0ABY7G7B3_MYAAR|nr:hypothetical protein MAR_032847 [Mya arenaria]